MLKIIFKFIFKHITNPLAININPIYEYIILIVIGTIAYTVAFRKVGQLYDSGFISGSMIGSVIHWTIRLILFILMWIAINLIIKAYYFIYLHYKLICIILFIAFIIVVQFKSSKYMLHN